MRLALVAVVFVTLAGWPHGPAAQPATPTPELDACVDGVDESAFRSSQIAGCYDQELKRQDQRLNAEYKALSAKINSFDPPSVKNLVAAQRQWLTFREAWCSFEEHLDAAPGPLANRMICMAEMTRAQADKLHASIP